jgi:hypothetical protein
MLSTIRNGSSANSQFTALGRTGEKVDASFHSRIWQFKTELGVLLTFLED